MSEPQSAPGHPDTPSVDKAQDDSGTVLQALANNATFHLKTVAEIAIEIIHLLKDVDEETANVFELTATSYLQAIAPLKRISKDLEKDLRVIQAELLPADEKSQEGKASDNQKAKASDTPKSRDFPKCKEWIEKITHAWDRKCQCLCDYRCNCACNCKCCCVCLDECRHNCKLPHTSRNLVVSIDGTSNQFGLNNTNVVELHSRIIKDHSRPQLTYYNSGIGTYAPPSLYSPAYWRQRISNKIDLAIAWNFEKIVRGAYRWLADHYQPGDQIYLFGFSRGAYQVRALAGMIKKVGLVFAGNQEQIPFAYELYAKRYKGKAHAGTDEMALHFKKTFSREIGVHFLGAWDTVSSVGIVRHKNLPFTDTCDHICFFRHALALDERRVKFLPEYLYRGVSSHGREPDERADNEDVDPEPLCRSTSPYSQALRLRLQPRHSSTLMPGSRLMLKAKDEQGEVRDLSPTFQLEHVHHDADPAHHHGVDSTHSKEVWFAGSHSDIGGGNRTNLKLDLAGIPLIWMENEATTAGLQLKPRLFEDGWNIAKIKEDEIKESLVQGWWVLECLPIKRLSYRDAVSTTRMPHIGKGRTIVPGQKIHASVAFKENHYRPCAQAISPETMVDWESLVGTGKDDDFSWTQKWEGRLEMDIFDRSLVQGIVDELLQDGIKSKHLQLSLNRLRFTALSSACSLHYNVTGFFDTVGIQFQGDGAKDIGERGLMAITNILTDGEGEVQATCVSCLSQLAKHFDIRETITKSKAIPTLVALLENYDLDKNVRASSLDCLSWCLKSRRLFLRVFIFRGSGRNHDANEVREAIIKTKAWTLLLEMLKEEDAEKQCRSASCLLRLVQDTRIWDEILMGGAVQELVHALTHMFKSRDYESRRISAVNLSRLVKDKTVRSAMVASGAIKTLASSLKSSTPSVQFWAASFLCEFTTYDDLCSEMTYQDVFKNVVEMVNSEHPGVAAACAVALSVSAAHKIARDAIIQADGLGVLAGMLSTSAPSISIVKALEQIGVPGDVMSTSNGKTGRLYSGAAALPELAKHGDVVLEILKSGIINQTLTLFKFSDPALQVCGATFFQNLTRHADARAQISSEVIRELMSMVNNPDSSVRRKATETFTELAKYQDTRKRILDEGVTSMLVRVLSNESYTASTGEAGVLAELAKNDDSIATFINESVIQTLVNLLSRHDKFEDNRRILNSCGNDQFAAAKIFAELAKRDDARDVMLGEKAVEALVNLLGKPDRDVTNAAAAALNELAKSGDKTAAIVNEELTRVLSPTLMNPQFRSMEWGDTMIKFLELEVIQALVEVLEKALRDLDRDRDRISHGRLLGEHTDQVAVVAHAFAKLAKHETARSLMLKARAVPALVDLLKMDGHLPYLAVNALFELATYVDARAQILEVRSQILEQEASRLSGSKLKALQDDLTTWTLTEPETPGKLKFM